MTNASEEDVGEVDRTAILWAHRAVAKAGLDWEDVATWQVRRQGGELKVHLTRFPVEPPELTITFRGDEL